LAEYDQQCRLWGPDALLSQDLWAKRIATLNRALEDAERRLHDSQAAESNLANGSFGRDMSQAEIDALSRRISRKERKTIIRVESAALGGSPEDISDVADQSGHIIEDSLSEDNGANRQRIAHKLRSMPRRMALEIIEQAVADRVISQQTADYLIREYVRTR